MILQCLHRFHKECVSTWFERKNTCPICKRRVSNDGDGEEEEQKEEVNVEARNDNPASTYAIFGEWPVYD